MSASLEARIVQSTHIPILTIAASWLAHWFMVICKDPGADQALRVRPPTLGQIRSITNLDNCQARSSMVGDSLVADRCSRHAPRGQLDMAWHLRTGRCNLIT